MRTPETPSDAPDPVPSHPHHQLRAMLKVGFIGFGGGSALIPVMERELVGRRGGLTEQEFVRDTVIANITPGALPVKLAALAGLRVRGPLTALVSAVLVALPGTALTVALLALFSSLGPGGIRVVEGLSLGVTAFILFLLAHYVTRVLRPAGRWHGMGLAIALLVFVVTGADATSALVSDLAGVPYVELPRFSAVAVIVLAIAAAGIVATVQWLRARRRQHVAPAGHHEHDDEGGPPARRVILAATALGVLALAAGALGVLVLPGGVDLVPLVTLSTVSSFGGGEAYVAVADGFFVAPGIVDSLDFYGQIVPVANALPGPILVKVAAGMGYSVGVASGGPLLGVALASVIMLVTIGVCAAIALALLAVYDSARRSRFVRMISAIILPVVCGLLASTSVALLHASAVIGERAELPGPAVVVGTIAVAAVVAIVHRRVRVPDLVVIAACALLSLAVVLAVSGLPA